MTQEKATKKRGRPAQLLNIAELSAFVGFLKEKKERSELQNQVIDALQQQDFNFELLSEAQKILVKEALRPYREHTKLTILAEQLYFEQNRSEYENKFLKLYQGYKERQLDQTDLNLLKSMCTRYLSYKAQKLQVSDLELYLSQIQKKEAKKKRSAENQRKFELGGAVIAAYKKLDMVIPEDEKRVTNSIVNNKRLWDKISRTTIYKAISNKDSSYFEDVDLFIKVLEGLARYDYKDQKLFEYEILKQKTELGK